MDTLHKETKIFVTGIYGSGKTTYAKEYAQLAGIKYIDFDMYFNYADTLSVLKASPDTHFINILSDNYVTDAIPWNPRGGSTEIFKKYAVDSNALIICCVCSSKEEWAQRLLVSKNLEINAARYGHYAHFYSKILPQYLDMNIKFYDTICNRYVEREEFFSLISWCKPYEDTLSPEEIR